MAMEELELIKVTSDSVVCGCGPTCGPSGNPSDDGGECGPDKPPCVPDKY